MTTRFISNTIALTAFAVVVIANAPVPEPVSFALAETRAGLILSVLQGCLAACVTQVVLTALGGALDLVGDAIDRFLSGPKAAPDGK